MWYMGILGNSIFYLLKGERSLRRAKSGLHGCQDVAEWLPRLWAVSRRGPDILL